MALTKQDFNQLRVLIDERLDEKLDKKLDEKLKFLPTKDQFYTKMDEVMGELKTIREEQSLLSHRRSNHEDRIVKIEKIHPYGQHAAL